MAAVPRKSASYMLRVRHRFANDCYDPKIEGIMKLSGYEDAGLPIEEIVPASLAEVTLFATPAELRRMAAFFEFCATEMDRLGNAYDHVHLGDKMKEFYDSPHLVVMRTVTQAR
ncbi:MAG: hypothetical protein V4484_00955 [Pseudomonadota bacterium]